MHVYIVVCMMRQVTSYEPYEFIYLPYTSTQPKAQWYYQVNQPLLR